MTLSNTETQVTVDGDDLTTVFNYTFPMGGSATYAVLIFTDSGGVTSTISSSLYTITGVDDPDGGTFTYPLVGSPISTGTTLTLQRTLPLVQDTAVGNQGSFYPSAVEGEFDYLTMITQQLQRQIDALEERVAALEA